MSGRVCPRHEEYCPGGVCRWCEPETTAGAWLANWKPAVAPVDKKPLFSWRGVPVVVDETLTEGECR